jgi:hypothetical protein
VPLAGSRAQARARKHSVAAVPVAARHKFRPPTRGTPGDRITPEAAVADSLPLRRQRGSLACGKGVGCHRPSGLDRHLDRFAVGHSATPRPPPLNTVAQLGFRSQRRAPVTMAKNYACVPAYVCERGGSPEPSSVPVAGCGHLALRDAIERLVQSLTDPPGLAVTHHGAGGVRMRWARRPSLSPVRFVIELHRDADGRLEGEITPRGDQPRAFSGTFDLLRVLEEHAPTHPGPSDRADGGSSGATEPARHRAETREGDR